MLPAHYLCTSCGFKFLFEFREASYFVGAGEIGDEVAIEALLPAPARPAWCKDCGQLCPVEDIASLRDFEDAYAAVRSGRSVGYPISTEHWDPDDLRRLFEAYLRWRMERRHGPRALCCGGSNYQLMDVPTPLFKHAECDFGVVEPASAFIGPYNWSPGISGPSDTRIYTTEGELIGLCTWLSKDQRAWKVERLSYPPAAAE